MINDPRLHRQVTEHPYPLLFVTIILDLIERKAAGTEKGTLEQSDLEFRRREYERLQDELEQAFECSRLPEQARGAEALNDLLVRVRMRPQPHP
jgi:hypothetical protein